MVGGGGDGYDANGDFGAIARESKVSDICVTLKC